MENCTLEQFNLVNFLAGKYKGFQTRNGKKVTSVTHFPESESGYVLAGVMHLIGGDIQTWTKDGLFLQSKADSVNDLFAWKQND